LTWVFIIIEFIIGFFLILNFNSTIIIFATLVINIVFFIIILRTSSLGNIIIFYIVFSYIFFLFVCIDATVFLLSRWYARWDYLCSSSIQSQMDDDAVVPIVDKIENDWKYILWRKPESCRSMILLSKQRKTKRKYNTVTSPPAFLDTE
ncbi:MAG: hypothetical protein D6748_14030, partial [Calditrichaeota bacterium]